MTKYQHPKILLVDVNEDVARSLRISGYNISLASLGFPYKVKHEDNFFSLLNTSSFPQNYKEQEIVVLNMCYDLSNSLEESFIEEEEQGRNKWWVKHTQGHINPRPLLGKFVQSDFDRILNTGGIFIIFADALKFNRYYFGKKDYFSRLQIDKEEVFNNWEFLSILGSSAERNIGGDYGETLSFPNELPKSDLIVSLLSDHLKGATYNCTFSFSLWLQKEWISLLKNKFAEDVAGLIIPSENRKGWILILPNLRGKTSLIEKLINQFLPNIVPDLFPEQEYSRWIHEFEYVLPKVKQLQQQIDEILDETKLRITDLEQQIKSEQNTYAYLFDLLTATGTALVQAVIETLERLGFQQIRDIDKELAEQGIHQQNREDLQIHDCDTKLIVEIKGISGFPSDEDILAVQKYVVLRMREWNSANNVQGLTIINHQRHLPPLDRNNGLPFRQEMLDASEEQRIGLLTTWDLHRLTRSFIQNKWGHEEIRNLFYQVGRINIVPSHYEFIGTIQRFIEKINIVGIQIEASILTVGDRVAFELPVVFEEQECESLQFENNPIEVAQVGMLVGTQTHLTKQNARVGVRVYKVTRILA